jgi:hypothetical protein
MKKQSPLKLKDMYIVQLITRGDHLLTQVYTVAAIRGLDVYLVWFEGSRMSGQWIDYSHSYRPTLEQIEYSIAANGRLASGQDIKDLDLP